MSARQPAPPRPRGRQPHRPDPLAGLTETVVQTADGPKRALAVEDTEPLPPPGDARREELRARHDDLIERLARIEAELGLDNTAGPPVDLARFSIENEIASKYDYIRVTDPVPEYAYYWANFSAAHGIDVTAHQVEGWEVVSGDMPECRHCRDELGRRRIGDTILMRIKLDEYLKLRQLDRAKRRMRSEGLDAALEELGERYRGRGVIYHNTLTDYQMQRVMRRAQAKQIAGQRMTDMLRRGAVPGLPVGR